MTTNKENFLKLVTGKDTQTSEEIKLRNKNRVHIRESKRIAVRVLLALKEQNMTQKDLADKMEVSPQYVNKLVKGGENLTLDTIIKIQNILNIRILDSFKPQEQISVTKSIEYNAPLVKQYMNFDPKKKTVDYRKAE